MRRNGSVDNVVCGASLAATDSTRRFTPEDWSFERSTYRARPATIVLEMGLDASLARFAQPLRGSESESKGCMRPTSGRRCALLLAGAVALALWLAALCGASTTSTGNHSRWNRIELVYASPGALRRALRANPARVLRLLTPLHAAEVRPLGDAQAYLRAIRRMPGISAARPVIDQSASSDQEHTLGATPTPYGEAYEWQYYATGVDRVPPTVLAAARDITIGVVDTGADLTAPDLSGRIVGVYNARTGAQNVTDLNGHGTFVASLAGGSATEGAMVAGFGGEARLLIVKVADSAGLTDIDIASGILYAVRHGSRVINLSFAGRISSPVEESAINYAAKRGVLLVAAAGNDALEGNPAEYPAALLQPLGSNGVGGLGLVVGASDYQGKSAPFSESGSFVSLAAPGASVFGAVSPRSSATAFPRSTFATPGVAGLYGFASGTSFAAPEVSGAAALVWAADPALTAREVADLLKQTASGRGSWTPDLGFGVIDVAAAVNRAIGMSSQ
jgi:subtilisin family serine protease